MSQILEYQRLIVVLGVISAVVGAIYAVFEREEADALGWNSFHNGIAILSPAYACTYAMQHGICKSTSVFNPSCGRT